MLPVKMNLSMAKGSTAGFAFQLQNEKAEDIIFEGFTATASARFLSTEALTVELDAQVTDTGQFMIFPPNPNTMPVGRYSWELAALNEVDRLRLVIATGVLEVTRGA